MTVNRIEALTNHRAAMISPFRYPGGKTWLVPLVCRWLQSSAQHPNMFTEPFAGGGSIGLNVAAKKLASHVTLVEKDVDIAAVWKTIIDADSATFAEQIATFDLNAESVAKVLAQEPRTVQERAFRTIIRNRVNRSGIMAPGAGMLREGENGNGIGSRWYPQTLKKRILTISDFKNHITFIEGDGLQVIEQTKDQPNTAFFIDPPYSVGNKQAGRRLYAHCDIDHNRLFELAMQIKGDFLMTYSNDEKVMDLIGKHNFDFLAVSMRSSHNGKMTELVIGRDLDWARKQ